MLFEGAFEGLAKIKENTERIEKAYEETHCSNILLDFSKMSGKVGIYTEHALGKHISKITPQGIRLAVLAPSYMKITASGHLENVVINRFTRLMVFWELQESIEWLKTA